MDKKLTESQCTGQSRLTVFESTKNTKQMALQGLQRVSFNNPAMVAGMP